MHTAPPRSRWMKRGFLGLPVAVWVFIGSAATALAVWGFIVLLGFSGSLTTGPGINVSYVAGTVSTDTNSSVGTCNASVDGNGHLQLDVQGMIETDYCYIEVDVVNDGDEPAKVQRIDVSDGWGLNKTVTYTQGGDFCGADVPADGTPYTVGFQFDGFGSPSQNYNFDPDWDGLTIVRADLFDAGQCD